MGSVGSASAKIVCGIALIATVAACSGTSKAPDMPSICPAALAYPYIPLLFPIPNSTGVPITAGRIVIGLAPGPTARIQDSSGRIVAQGALQAAPSPLPSPMASPVIPSALASLAYPALAPQTTYTITLDTVFTGCLNQSYAVGGFTTGN